MTETNMNKLNVSRLRGLKSLVQDAVINGAKSIEQVHMATAARSFNVLEKFPVVAGPSQIVRGVHDAVVKSSYAATRAVTEAVGAGLDRALDAVDNEPASASATAAQTDATAAPANDA